MVRLPKRRIIAGALAAVMSLQAGSVSALGLIEAYEAALQNDPTFRAAVHENEAGQQNKLIGRSALLPNVSAGYSHTRNRADITQPNVFGQVSTTHPEYNSSVGTLQLRQPLLNLDGIARYRQGIAQTDYSDAVFAGRRQELVIRLVSAYADAQYAEDQLMLATAQRDAFAEQMRVNERMFQKGEGTRTDMLETQAKFDVAEAQVIEARDNLTTARNALAAIVGMEVKGLDPLSDDFRVLPMQPESFEDWKALALENNPEISAQRHAVEATRHEVSRNRAGHAPRLDMVASLSKNKGETLNTFNQESTVRAVGVQLNIPLYSGGYVNATTTQAVSNHEKAKSDLEAKTNQALVELRKQYSLVLSSAAKIDALNKSVKSATLLVSATEQSIKGGVRINLDLLNAKQQYYTARRDLAQARYNYLLSFLRLRSAAGTLGADDLHMVAGYFVKDGAQQSMLPVVLPARVAARSEPAAATVNPAQGSAREQDEVLKVVTGWTKAWSAKDIGSYLAFYANDFQPEKGQSRDAWEKERSARILRKSAIVVQVESPEVVMNGDNATVKFRQLYKSGNYADETNKALELRRGSNGWKIRREVGAG
ncbi:MAG TPA: TolC family outer membrane protein [Noviherbaspirillum sp.]|nr:TolC family outer membrane protein [Noviherbaspirillum sp.]